MKKTLILSGTAFALSAAQFCGGIAYGAAERFPIRVNGAGYLPDAAKKCYAKNPPQPTFLVQRGGTDVRWHTVATGVWTRAAGEWHSGDFSSVREPGDYRILCGPVKEGELFRMPDWRPEAQSFHFQVRKGVYDPLERVALSYVTAQRCGSKKGWAGVCHQDRVPLVDAAGKTVGTLDVRGGYHQSCDLRSWHDGISMSMFALLRYAELKTPDWDDGNLAAEIRWGCDYFLKVISPSGYVYDAQFAPIGWGPRRYYAAPATLGAQCNTVALFARASRFFAKADPAYASKLLAAARRVWRTVETDPFFEKPQPAPEKNLPAGSQPAERCYPQQYRTSVNGLSERAHAALELYRSTREPEFADAAKRLGGEMLGFLVRRGPDAGIYRNAKGEQAFGDWSYCWRISGYRTPFELWREFGDDRWLEAALIRAERLVRDWRRDPMGWRGTTSAAADATYLSEVGALCGRDGYRTCAQEMFDWIFGLNSWNRSLMEGIGQNQWQRPVFGQFFPSTPQLPGGVLHTPNGEYDMPATVFAMWAAAVLETAKPVVDVTDCRLYPCAVRKGNAISVDLPNSPDAPQFRRILETSAGLLKPGRHYVATFDANVAASSADASLLVLVRPEGVGNHMRDAASDFLMETRGRFRPYRLSFDTGSVSNFLFKLSAKGAIRAEIRNLRVVVGEGLKRIPLAPPPSVPAARPTGLPEGARPVTVDPPRPGRELALKAEDFGVSSASADNTPAMNAALAACRERKASRLTVAPGTYRFTSDASLLFKDMSDFTFDGGGAAFVFHRRRASNFVVTGCERTVIRNFSVDWDWERDPLASVVRVVAKDADTVDFLFEDYDRFPRRDVRLVYASPWDPETRSVGFEGSGTGIGFEFAICRGEKLVRNRLRWLSDNVLRAGTDRAAQFAVGSRWRMQHYYYHLNGFQLRDNAHFALEDVEIRSNPGHALVVSGRQRHWRFSRVNIRVPEGDRRRVITCTADHCHVVRSLGDFLIEDCEFSRGADDCVNIHDCTAYAPRRDGASTLVTANCGESLFAVGDEAEVRRTDYSPIGFRGRIASIRTLDRARGELAIAFDRPLPPPGPETGYVIFNRSYGTRNVIMRNCFFHDNRARGVIVQADDVTIENCRFLHNESAALKVTTGYTLSAWCEGCGVSNLVVRGCRFEKGNATSTRVTGWARDVFLGTYLGVSGSRDMTDYPILRDILFENNTFTDSYGLVARIASASDVTFLGNTIRQLTPRRREFPYRGGFMVDRSRNVRFIGTKVEPSPLMPHPDVLVDVDTVKGIEVR